MRNMYPVIHLIIYMVGGKKGQYVPFCYLAKGSPHIMSINSFYSAEYREVVKNLH